MNGLPPVHRLGRRLVRRLGHRPALRDDGGQVLLLILVYTMIAVALLAVLASATAVHLARHRLQAVADAAALDAADALDQQRFYAVTVPGGLPAAGGLPVATATVRTSVDAYLAARAGSAGGSAAGSAGGSAAGPTGGSPEPAVVEPTGSPDALTAQVSLATQVHLPLLSPVLDAWGAGLQVEVTSRARATTVLP